jgi:hypothetical protein
MDTLPVIIIGVIILLIIRIRNKRKNSFKLIIEKGIIIKHSENVPSEFLYDVQQLARINKPDSLIINGSEILSKSPKLEFNGIFSPDLQSKIERSLRLSLQ